MATEHILSIKRGLLIYKIVSWASFFIFVLAATGMLSFMMQRGPESAGRFQFYNFQDPGLIRTIADTLEIISLVILAINEIKDFSINYKLRWGSALLYTFFILIDINSWLLLRSSNTIYDIILLVHGLPLLVISCNFYSDKKYTHKLTLIAGILLLTVGIAWRYYFFNQISKQLFDADSFYDYPNTMRIIGWFYFTGILLGLIGLFRFLQKRLHI